MADSRHNHPVMSGRSLSVLCLAMVSCSVGSASVLFAQTPGNKTAQTGGLDDPPPPPPPWVDLNVPSSRFLTGIEFAANSRRTAAPGSDIWPITWADDGHQYAAFGDGGGFGGTNQDGRVSLGLSRIEGNQQDYVGINVWGGKDAENPAQFTGKGTGLLCVDGVLYMWVGRPEMLSETVLAISHDHSRTWQLADWHWSMQDRLFAGAFVNCGRNDSDAPDGYVYACFTRINSLPAQPRSWLHERPGRVDLARAPKDQILEESRWEWFRGIGKDEQPLWTPNLAKRQPAFEDANGIQVVSVCYQSALHRYLLTYAPRDNGGNFALFEAPRPWGPWRQVAYLKAEPLFMPPKPNRRVSIFHFAPKWWSNDGRQFTLVFNAGDDAWNTVRGRFEVANRVDDVP